MRSVLRGARVVGRDIRDPAVAARTAGGTSSDDARWEDWFIETLVAQLNGDDPDVARAALSVLEEAVQDERCLRTLVG